MGYFYFDESIHQQAGFITGCAIYSDSDLNQEVANAIEQSGLNRIIDEHKSGIKIAGDENRLTLRDKLFSIFQDKTKFGLTFVSTEEREILFNYGLKLIEKIIKKNKLSSQFHEVFFDEGISNQKAFKVNHELLAKINIHVGQDSKIIRGIQIADLISHTCSMMLKESLGLLNKGIKAGENSGYPPESLIEIGFTMWATIRYNFFQGEAGVDPTKALHGFTNVADYGLLISESFNPVLREAIQKKFASNYLGCIH
jgi:hypothetical protein